MAAGICSDKNMVDRDNKFQNTLQMINSHQSTHTL